MRAMKPPQIDATRPHFRVKIASAAAPFPPRLGCFSSVSESRLRHGRLLPDRDPAASLPRGDGQGGSGSLRRSYGDEMGRNQGGDGDHFPVKLRPGI